jgi:FixJ family two-component response regulator
MRKKRFPVPATAPSPTRKSVHVIELYEPNHESYLRFIRRRLGDTPAEIKVFTDHTQYFNAVAPNQLPDVLVLSNRQKGMTGIDLATKLRREGYSGKAFIFTGGPEIELDPESEGDDVFYKPFDTKKLLDAIYFALHAPNEPH